MEYLPGQTLKEIEEKERMLPLGPRPRDRQGHLRRTRGRAPHRRAAPGPQARERDRRRGRQAPADGLRHRDRVQRSTAARRATRSPARRSSWRRSCCAGEMPSPADRRLRDGRPALRDVHRPRALRRQRHGPAGAPRHLREGRRGSRRSGPTCRRSCATSSSARSPRIPTPRFPDATVALRRDLGLRGPGPRPRAGRGLGHARHAWSS